MEILAEPWYNPPGTSSNLSGTEDFCMSNDRDQRESPPKNDTPTHRDPPLTLRQSLRHLGPGADNYIAFEYPTGNPEWWYDIIEGLPNPIVKDSYIDVWDTPGLGVSFKVDEAIQYLKDDDAGFFD